MCRIGDSRPLRLLLAHFFPASGNRNGTGLNNRGSNGNYWSASLNSAANGYNLNFNSGGVNPANNNNRFNGFSVRAVQHLPAGTSGDAKRWNTKGDYGIQTDATGTDS